VDCAYQRRSPPVRHDLQPVRQRTEKAHIEIDRKVLSDIAVHDMAAFAGIVEQVKAKLAA
jgi:ribosomal protein L20